MPVKKQEFVKKEEFDKLFNVVTDLAKSVGELKQKTEETPKVNVIADEPPSKRDEPVEPLSIPPAYRKLVDEVLGQDFGIDVSYPITGSGFQLKIIVPDEKSNMTPAYKEMYRFDVRTKAIPFSEGIDGVRKHLDLIAKNLGLNKK